MPHLHDADLLSLLLGEGETSLGEADHHPHVPGCDLCQQRLKETRELLGALALGAGKRPSPGRQRLLGSVAWLERYTPLAAQVGAALRVEPNLARRALHELSDEQGWVSVPMLPDLQIRPVRVGPSAAPREIDGAIFARVEPGGRIPRHVHHGPEVMLVLEGLLTDATDPAVRLGPGGELRSTDSTEHELVVPSSPAERCVCLVVNDGWAEYL